MTNDGWSSFTSKGGDELFKSVFTSICKLSVYFILFIFLFVSLSENFLLELSLCMESLSGVLREEMHSKATKISKLSCQQTTYMVIYVFKV